jgi:hypothetical protein
MSLSSLWRDETRIARIAQIGRRAYDALIRDRLIGVIRVICVLVSDPRPAFYSMRWRDRRTSGLDGRPLWAKPLPIAGWPA